VTPTIILIDVTRVISGNSCGRSRSTRQLVINDT